MYQILGIRLALTLFGTLCAAVFVLWAVIAPPADPTVLAWWSIASGAASGTALVVAVVGQSALFPWLCRLPLISKWLPPIDGHWNAALESNWPSIQNRPAPGTKPVLLAPVPASARIIARLFYIRMNLASDDRYSTSKTIFVRATRDIQDGSVTLHYVYRNSTLSPQATDSGSHDGAGCLHVEGEGDGLWLEGVYWTNRNWHLGLNTAGKITLHRA